jgi:hypothetical protein
MKENSNPVIHSIRPDIRKERPKFNSVQQRWMSGSLIQALLSTREENHENTLTSKEEEEKGDVDHFSKHYKLLDDAIGGWDDSNLDISSLRNSILEFVPSCEKRQMQASDHTFNKGETTATPPDPIDADEVFDLIRNIQDPEHPLTLEQLSVVRRGHVEVKDTTDVRTSSSSPIARKLKTNSYSSSPSQISTVKVRFT